MLLFPARNVDLVEIEKVYDGLQYDSVKNVCRREAFFTEVLTIET